jgi:large subunit ribosomal protein L25
MATTVSITASVRPETGKGAARRARRQGQVPAVVYMAKKVAATLQLDPVPLERAFLKSQNRNTLVDLQIEGEPKRLCLVKEAQRHPVSRRLVHVDFLEVDPAQDIVVEVPIKPHGKSLGERGGGLLRIIRRTLPVRAKPENIPDAIDVDVTELDVNKFIKASMIANPPNSQILFTGDFNVIGIIGKQKLEQDIAAALAKPEPTVVEGAEGAAAAEGGEGAAAAEGAEGAAKPGEKGAAAAKPGDKGGDKPAGGKKDKA